MEALIIVDIQNDFLPGGALAVERGDQVIPVVNKLTERYGLVVATQDWHPPDHKSFAVSHEGKRPGDKIMLQGLEQVLWPVHCVMNTKGADLAPALQTGRIREVFRKGVDPEVDSYSGFFDNGHKRSTGLHDYLKAHGVDAVAVVGLATDYCVKFTALDAMKLGYQTRVIAGATRAVGGEPARQQVLAELQQQGATIVIGAEPTGKG